MKHCFESFQVDEGRARPAPSVRLDLSGRFETILSNFHNAYHRALPTVCDHPFVFDLLRKTSYETEQLALNIRAAQSLVDRLGLDFDHVDHFGGDTAEEVLLVDGDRVEFQGEAHREHVPTAGAYRGGEMLVMQGKPGAPVLLTRVT